MKRFCQGKQGYINFLFMLCWLILQLPLYWHLVVWMQHCADAEQTWILTSAFSQRAKHYSPFYPSIHPSTAGLAIQMLLTHIEERNSCLQDGVGRLSWILTARTTTNTCGTLWRERGLPLNLKHPERGTRETAKNKKRRNSVWGCEGVCAPACFSISDSLVSAVIRGF